MATRETKILLFRAPSVTPGIGEVGLLGINLYEPGITNSIGEGWEAVSHTFADQQDGSSVVSILVQRVTQAPDYA